MHAWAKHTPRAHASLAQHFAHTHTPVKALGANLSHLPLYWSRPASTTTTSTAASASSAGKPKSPNPLVQEMTDKPPVRTFALQSSLPRLPLPPLRDTAQRYLKSLKPVLSEQEYAKSEQIVNSFFFDRDVAGNSSQSLAERLQQRLSQVDAAEPNSWLERWWLRLAYHSWREPLLVNSNWYMIAAPHPATPPNFNDPNSELRKRIQTNRTFTKWQVKRASGVVSAFLDIKDKIESETLPVEMTRGGGSLCMDQYTHIFGVTRVPKPNCDVNRDVFPSPSSHILVHVRDQIYKVAVYDSQTSSRVKVSDIELQLQKVVDDVKSLGKDQLYPPVGIFSALHRDKWADIHQRIEDHSPVNRATFAEIETALFSICLDDYSKPINDPNSSHEDYLIRNTFHGFNGHNRWFDKCISLIFMNDGSLGMMGEHSPCDALIPGYVYDAALSLEPVQDPESAPKNVTPTLEQPQRLAWKIPKSVEEEIPNADKEIQSIIMNSDQKVLNFKEFGSDFIKKFGKCSPDAFLQMAIQLAFYKLHGYVVPVYETASTRKYLHGRTETCRSLSEESKKFVEIFEGKSSLTGRPVTSKDKYDAFQLACKKHIEYISAASDGHGVDRHLMGLRLCLKEGETAEIFNDPAFGKSSNWRLSTSALFAAPHIRATGFGAVVPDGYGMNYMIAPQEIKVGLESKFSCKETSTLNFHNALKTSLLEIANMCREVNGGAKL